VDAQQDVLRGDTATLRLPVGTHIVTRAIVATEMGTVRPPGTVGIVTAAVADDTNSYSVRFPDGSTASLHRRELSVRKAERLVPLRSASDDDQRRALDSYVIYRCVVGSQAYGLAGDDSDIDRRGIYLPSARLHWSLFGLPEQLEYPDSDACCWELQKFLTLALRANPNILECLFTPLVEHATPLAQELRDMRAVFLSKLVYQTYNGYVMSQFKKLEVDLRTKGTLRWKHAMHLIRLLLSGIWILREGNVPLRVDSHQEQLLAIRRGEVPWTEVDAWRLMLHKEFDASFMTTALPDRPDYDRADAFLIRARRSMVEGNVDD
jgi:hypothetical protein